VAEDDDVTRVFLLDNLAFGRLRRGGRGGTGAALRAVEVRRPALVVLDLGLDDRSGLGLLDRARSFAGVPTTTCAGSQGRRRPSALTGDTSV
jgi:DNA-binding response OmpR family regulator